MIHEDPDELGYWVGQPPDLTQPELPACVTSVVAANVLLSEHERGCIMSAAINAAEGNHWAAEQERVRGGYGGLGRL